MFPNSLQKYFRRRSFETVAWALGFLGLGKLFPEMYTYIILFLDSHVF